MHRGSLFFLLIIPTLSWACAPVAIYRQCDARWGTQELGTSGSTICDIGCAMSCAAMIVHTHGITIPTYGVSTPGSLDKWLTRNNGYLSGSNLIWASVEKLSSNGQLKMEQYTSSMTLSSLKSLVQQCKMIITNVKNGGHWVLITGLGSSSDTFQVNDPGYSGITTYPFSEMSKWTVYSAAPYATNTPSPSPTNTPTLASETQLGVIVGCSVAGGSLFVIAGVYFGRKKLPKLAKKRGYAKFTEGVTPLMAQRPKRQARPKPGNVRALRAQFDHV